MGNPRNIICGLFYFGCAWGKQNENRLGVGLRFSRGDMAFGTSQAASVVVVLPVIFTGLRVLLVVSGYRRHAQNLVGLQNFGEGCWES